MSRLAHNGRVTDGAFKHNVAKAGVIMVASLFLSRVLGLIRDMVIAAKFGQTQETDAYLASFQVPDLLFYLIAGGALSSAFIPVFSEYLHTDREDEAWHVFSVVVSLMSAVVLAFIIVAWIFADPLMSVVASGLDPETARLAAQMSRIVVPSQYAFFIGGIMLGTMYARNVFSVPGLAPNVYNIGIIVGALVVSNLVVPSVTGMSWGALGGAFVGNIFIPLLVMRRLGVKFKISFDTKHEGVRKVFRLMIPVVLGLSLPGIFTWILRSYGSFFEQGVITALENSNRLMQAPLGVFGQALALAAFPVLAQFKTQDRMDLFSDQLSKTLRTVLFLSIPVAMIFIVLPLPIIQAMYVRGKFTMEDAYRTAPLLQMFGIGVAAWCLQPALMRAYYSVQKTWPPVIMGTLTTLVFALASYFLIQSGAGYQSLPKAASVAAIFLAVLMIGTVNHSVSKIDIAGLLTTSGKSILASGIAAAIAWGAMKFSPPPGAGLSFAPLAMLLVVACFFGWVYYFAAKALKMPETEYVKRAMARRGPQPSQE